MQDDEWSVSVESGEGTSDKSKRLRSLEQIVPLCN